MVSLAERRRAAVYLEKAHAVSERRACRVLQLLRSTKRRQPGSTDELALVRRLIELSERYPRFGYRKIHWKLRDEDWDVSRERVRLIRRREGLRVSGKKPRKRRRGTSTTDISRAEFPNHVWSYDFVSDQTTDGKTLKCLTVVDEFTREGMAIRCGRSMTSGDVIRALETLFPMYGTPVCIRSDNGPELVAKHLQKWLKDQMVKTRYIDPGSPWQNAYNESFNGVFRDGCLNRWLFGSTREAQRVIDQWLYEYNEERPHGSLDGQTPAMFAAQFREQGEVA